MDEAREADSRQTMMGGGESDDDGPDFLMMTLVIIAQILLTIRIIVGRAVDQMAKMTMPIPHVVPPKRDVLADVTVTVDGEPVPHVKLEMHMRGLQPPMAPARRCQLRRCTQADCSPVHPARRPQSRRNPTRCQV